MARQNALQWYPHYLADYERDTAHLSMIEDGAYRRLLDKVYLTQKPLPSDMQALYRLTRAISGEEQAAVDTIIATFFSSTPAGFIQKRAALELEKSADISAKRSSASRARHRIPGGTNGHSIDHPNDESNGHSIDDTPTPTPTSHKDLGSKTSLGNGMGSGGYARETTIEDPNDRIARFQAKIAKHLGPKGWGTVIAACTPSTQGHSNALAACKQAARDLGKGWPRNWPVLSA